MLSLKFSNVYINSFYTIVGKNEKQGNIKRYDDVISDYYNGEKTFELSQIKLEKEVIYKLLLKNNLINNDIDLVIGGDLLNQITGTTYALKNMDISFLGVYGACSSFIESLIVASEYLLNDNINKVVCLTGSHTLSAERQFRYPVEYGAIRNVNSTFTATGAIACLLSNKKGIIKIKSATIGSVCDLEIKDPNMIGAVMAPAAAEVIYYHLNNHNIDSNYYDLILTGDLGSVGLNILIDYLNEEYNLKFNNILDAGSRLYKNINDINDGASGPFALPLYFFNNTIMNKKYKRILLVGTGALHSSTMVNQKQSIPSIAHVIGIEVL